MYKFPKMVDILKPGESGDARLSHFTVDQFRSAMSYLRPSEGTPEGSYIQLHVGGRLMMSDTPNEHRTNYGVVHNAFGHVFIAGLGVGMICHALAAKPKVTKITVLEKSQGVIDLVKPSLPDKVEVIQGDIFEFKPAKGVKYDTIYFDIWPDICTDNLPEMAKLHRKFGRYLAECGWMDSWCRDILKARKRREDRQERRWGW